jgi:hypothetical protein
MTKNILFLITDLNIMADISLGNDKAKMIATLNPVLLFID